MPGKTKHGMSGTLVYKVWGEMIQRCTNPNNEHWARYGGRGISVCDRWREFTAFQRDMGERPKGLTLDRINNDGNYEPGNCRWATRTEQNLNKPKQPGCASRHKGVHWLAKRGKWRAVVYVGREQKYVGYFDSEDAAAAELARRAVRP